MDNIKKFEDFLDRMKGLLDNAKKQGDIIVRVEDLENTFPELQESEDERIRKGIIDFLWKEKIFLQEAHSSVENNPKYRFVMDAIAWLEKQGTPKQVSIWKHWKDGIAGNGEGKPIYLVKNGNTYNLNSCLCFECDYIELSELDNLMLEKQGETFTKKDIDDAYIEGMAFAKNELEKQGQKPTDKVESRFKIGDWIVDKSGLTQQVLDFRGGIYTCTYNSFTTDCESNYHLWTIEDAKDGDVLIDKSGSREGPFIFKETKPSDIKTNMLNPLTVLGYCGIGGAGFTKGIGWGDTANCIYYPATKEQRELLFKRMHEAGYEWNADKKELKKINSYCQEHCKGYQETGKCFVDGGCNAKREAEKIENTSPLLSDFFNAEYERGKADALKCAEWSEEDERMCQNMLECLRNGWRKLPADILKYESWLKSLKPQKQWKPSKEQMEALKASYLYWNGITKEIPYAERLESLYEQLKKLTE